MEECGKYSIDMQIYHTSKENRGNLSLKLQHFTPVPSHSQKSVLSCWGKFPSAEKKSILGFTGHQILEMDLK